VVVGCVVAAVTTVATKAVMLMSDVARRVIAAVATVVTKAVMLLSDVAGGVIAAVTGLGYGGH
jgi:hypothetical protein